MRQKLSRLLEDARNEEVIIKKRNGEVFFVIYRKPPVFPFDVKGVKTKTTIGDILEAVEESRVPDSGNKYLFSWLWNGFFSPEYVSSLGKV